MNGKRRWAVGRTRPLEAGLHRTAAPFVGRGMGRQKGSKWSWSRKVRVDQRIPANARFHKGPRMPRCKFRRTAMVQPASMHVLRLGSADLGERMQQGQVVRSGPWEVAFGKPRAGGRSGVRACP